MMGALKDSKNPFFFSLFVAVKFKRFKEDPFAKKHQFIYLYSRLKKTKQKKIINVLTKETTFQINDGLQRDLKDSDVFLLQIERIQSHPS